MALLVNPPPAPVQSYVTLQAGDLRALWNALKEIQDRQGYLGLTEMSAPDCEAASVDRDGIVHDVTVKSQITIRMPQWANRDEASESERAEWERFHAALLTHERGHERIMRDGLKAMYKALEKARATEFQAIIDRENLRIDRAGTAYDQRTDKGRKQGAILNAPAAP